jgi:ubiquinone biosynthesis accessory factor UbiJ
MTFPFNPVEKFQAMFNRVLQQDPQACAAMKDLSGKMIAIEVIGTGLGWYVYIDDQGISLGREHAGQANVTIKARAATLIGLLLNHNSKVSGINPDMEINGDVGLAQEFQLILKNLDIDWEEHLSHWLGDTAAHKFGRVYKLTRNFIRESRHTISMDISEYLRYEKEILPEREEIELFNNAVDKIRNDTERLKQRLQRLQEKIIQDKN